MNEEQICENFKKIYGQIKDTAVSCGRDIDSVKLCAVSKFHPVNSVYAAMKVNHMLFGENRVQEAYAKFSEINEDESVAVKPELHIIGSLQSNKVKKAVEIASCIESVDRKELLDEIEKQCRKFNKTIRVFFELHTGEESKSGYESVEILRESVKLCAEGNYLHIIADGFMTMAPFTEDENIIRNSFRKLRETAEELRKEFPQLPLKELSMGMSGDYKIAIQEGSTEVRIGTALFGEREYPAVKE